MATRMPKRAAKKGQPTIDPKQLYKIKEVQELAVHIRRLVDQARHLYAELIDHKTGEISCQESVIVKDLEACGFHAEFGDIELPRKKTKRGLYIGIPKEDGDTMHTEQEVKHDG